MNWVLYYYNVCDDFEKLEIICMDENVAEDLMLAGLKCSAKSFHLKYSRDSKNKLGKIWLHRVEIIADYIISGYDVVLSDSDAIFLTKDMFADFSSLGQHSEFIASRAWWPWPQFQKWGACACMGFAYAKAGPFMSDVFVNIRRELQRQELAHSGSPDDQIAVNTLLESWNITWLGTMSVGDNKTPDTGIVVRNNSEYKVTLLSHAKYIRKCHHFKSVDDLNKEAQQEVIKNVKDAVVAHCRLPKGEGTGKSFRLQAYGLWKLQDRWRSDLSLLRAGSSGPQSLLTIAFALPISNSYIPSLGETIAVMSINQTFETLRREAMRERRNINKHSLAANRSKHLVRMSSKAKMRKVAKNLKEKQVKSRQKLRGV